MIISKEFFQLIINPSLLLLIPILLLSFLIVINKTLNISIKYDRLIMKVINNPDINKFIHWEDLKEENLNEEILPANLQEEYDRKMKELKEKRDREIKEIYEKYGLEYKKNEEESEEEDDEEEKWKERIIKNTLKIYNYGINTKLKMLIFRNLEFLYIFVLITHRTLAYTNYKLKKITYIISTINYNIKYDLILNIITVIICNINNLLSLMQRGLTIIINVNLNCMKYIARC